MQGAQIDITPERAFKIIREALADDERKKLKTALMHWLIAVIDVLAQVEKDRPGAARLAEKRLVSDEYWEGVQEAFGGIHEAIEEINKEADELEEGWSQAIFPQALQFWRLQKFRESQNESDQQEK